MLRNTLCFHAPCVMCLSSELPPARTVKKRQGVIWGKSSSSLKGNGNRILVQRLADFVHLHSTVALKDTPAG